MNLFIIFFIPGGTLEYAVNALCKVTHHSRRRLIFQASFEHQFLGPPATILLYLIYWTVKIVLPEKNNLSTQLNSH